MGYIDTEMDEDGQSLEASAVEAASPRPVEGESASSSGRTAERTIAQQ